MDEHLHQDISRGPWLSMALQGSAKMLCFACILNVQGLFLAYMGTTPVLDISAHLHMQWI